MIEMANMSETKPLISVIIPTYNYSATLPRTVESVRTQLTETNELIIIDDGSSDDTQQVLEKINELYPGSFRSVYKQNGGPASARNIGILQSKGEYLLFLDADDELAPNALKTLEEHIKHNQDTRMILAGYWTVTDDGKRKKHLPSVLPGTPMQRLRSYLLDKKISISHGACAMHRDVFLLGNYPENFRNSEDIPVFAQAIANYPCTILKYPLALIHKHHDSLRHQFKHTETVGLSLVDEVFSPQRLGNEFQTLKSEYFIKRCLSLSRNALKAGDSALAKKYFTLAFKKDWRVILNSSYWRKILRLLMK